VFNWFQRACDFPVFAHLALSLRSLRSDITIHCRDCPLGLGWLQTAVGVVLGSLPVEAFNLEFAHPLGLRRLQSFPFLTGKGRVACLAGV
jgi:hypothetical protein